MPADSAGADAKSLAMFTVIDVAAAAGVPFGKR
jgi:hypothetical protein